MRAGPSTSRQGNFETLLSLRAFCGESASRCDGEAHRDVDRVVRDLTVADLQHDGVDQQHRVDDVEWPRPPLLHVLDCHSCDLRDLHGPKPWGSRGTRAQWGSPPSTNSASNLVVG